MCLGIPGKVVGWSEQSEMLAAVEVSGVIRDINIGMLESGEVRLGDWVLIHLGFAVEVIDEQKAQQALDGLKLMGSGMDPPSA